MSNSRSNVHFDTVASQYDDLRTLNPEPVKWLVEQLPENTEVLCDLGTGTGRYAFELAKQLHDSDHALQKIYGVDTSKEMLIVAEKEATRLSYPGEWLHTTAQSTGIRFNSVSLVTSFNSVHYFSLPEVLAEVQRILCPNGYFFIYTRLREQESEHVWGNYFPRYLDFSLVPDRSTLLNIEKNYPNFLLLNSKEFRFPRRSTFERVIKQTKEKFYSTLARYSDQEFSEAFEIFAKNLRSHCNHDDTIDFYSSYSCWLYKVSKLP